MFLLGTYWENTSNNFKNIEKILRGWNDLKMKVLVEISWNKLFLQQ